MTRRCASTTGSAARLKSAIFLAIPGMSEYGSTKTGSRVTMSPMRVQPCLDFRDNGEQNLGGTKIDDEEDMDGDVAGETEYSGETTKETQPMYALIENSDSDAENAVTISVVHQLPGRLRLHVSDWSENDREDLERTIEVVRGVQRVQANARTGNVLILYDTAITDQRAVLEAVQSALTLSGWPVLMEPGTDVSDRGASHVLRHAGVLPAPNPGRVVMPVLHLVYSASPVGVALHLGEIGWVLNRKQHPGRLAMPVLHLAFSFSTIGIVLHVGELMWALAPFAVPGRGIRAG